MVEMLVSGTAVFAADQAAKRAAELHAATRAIRVGPLLNIRHALNRRSIYAHLPARAVMLVVWIAAFTSAMILAASLPGPLVPGIGLGMALGGAAGNLADILRLHAVRDFVDLGWWPVFNVADVAIIAGLALTFLAP